MKHLWQRLINKIARKLKSFGTLDSERALREKNMRILELEQALAQKPPWIDPTIRQRGYEQSAWNAEPSPQTDPQLYARLEAQKRKDDMKAFLDCASRELPRIPRFNAPANVRSGELSRKYSTRKLDDVTIIMPAVQREAQIQRYQDQNKKIS